MVDAAVSTGRRKAPGTASQECASALKPWAAGLPPARGAKEAFAFKPGYP